MSDNTQLLDPEEAAESTVDDEWCDGIQRDILVDTRIAAESATSQLTDIYTLLDVVADTHDLPHDLCMEIREVQAKVGSLQDWSDEYRVALEEELHRFRCGSEPPVNDGVLEAIEDELNLPDDL